MKLLGGGSVGCRGALGDLFFNHAHDLLVRRPEGLRDTDRVLDNLGDRGIPVPPFAVIEDAIAADHKVVGIASSESGYDLQLLAGGLAHTIAVSQVGARKPGQQGVPAAILDSKAEVAATLVQIEGASLKDRLVLPPVEIPEGNEVVKQLVKVTVISGELLHCGDSRELRLQTLIFGDKFGEGVLSRAG